MKKYLQLCFICALAAVSMTFGSCKDDDEGGSSNPLLGLKVDLSSVDSTAIALVNIDQTTKTVTISLSKLITNPLNAVPCTFDLVQGANLYSPFLTNPVKMDLTKKTGVNIMTGGDIVCYTVITEVDYALKGLKATVGDVQGVATVDQENGLIDIYFGANAVDLTKVNIDFNISPVTTMVNPSSVSTTMDLSADTTMISFDNEFAGRVNYKVVCWNDPADGKLSVRKATDLTFTGDAANGFAFKVTGTNPSFVTDRFPVEGGQIVSFEYKSADSLGRPIIGMQPDNNDFLMRGLALTKTGGEWKQYTINLGSLYFDNADVLGGGYPLYITFSEAQKGNQIEIRNLTVRPLNAYEQAVLDSAYFLDFDSRGGNTCSVTNMTTDDAYKTFRFLPTAPGDPYVSANNHDQEITREMYMFGFEYKSEATFNQEFYMREIGGYSFEMDEKFKPSEIWTVVEENIQAKFEKLFNLHPNAGEAGAYCRWDPFGVDPVNVPIIIRNPHFAKKSYQVVDLGE